jgi:hypothetical protein
MTVISRRFMSIVACRVLNIQDVFADGNYPKGGNSGTHDSLNVGQCLCRRCLL